MTIKKGNPELIEQAKRASLQFYGMDGDGVQAPGAVVIRDVGGVHPFVVHFANTQSGGYHEGSYCQTLEKAIARFNERVSRYDPTGDLNRSFNGLGLVDA